MKKALPWIIVGVILFSAGFAIAHFRGNAAVAEAKAQAEQDKANALADQIKGLSDQIAKSEVALQKVEADAAANERAFLSALAQVKTATPQQLVDEGSKILGASDIHTDGKAVTMSVDTYRLVVSDLLELKEYKQVREPSWLTQKGLLNDEIAQLKAQATLQGQRDAALTASIADLKSFISQQKVSSVLEKVLWAGAGIGAGILAGHFLK